jgi:hypothetical protein
MGYWWTGLDSLGLTAWAAFLRLISIPVKEHAMCSVTGIDGVCRHG